ncbi:MAG: serpin family protein, partial [Lachnospiraceae bacterium]
MTGSYTKKVLKSGLALTLAFSLSACGGAGKTDGSGPAKEAGQATEAANAGQTEIQDEDVTAAQHGQAADYLVSKKVVLPAQYVYPKEEDFTNKDGEFDFEAYDKAMEEWISNNEARQAISDETINKLYDYYKKTVPYILQYKEGENILYSPVNVYMALGMLGEITAGETRQQILDLLGEKDIESLRESVGQIWNSSYVDDGSVTSILAASLWMNQDIEFNQETVDQLAETYFAESYRGQTGSPGMNAALQQWLNEHTGNLLQEQAGQVELEPDTLLALATTIYFKAGWAEQFNKEMTSTETFHAVSGDLEKEFLHGTETGLYYWGDHFTAVDRQLMN